jgi:hypothetical protein
MEETVKGGASRRVLLSTPLSRVLLEKLTGPQLVKNILTMHGLINVKSPNNTSKLQMGFNSGFNLLVPEFYI